MARVRRQQHEQSIYPFRTGLPLGGALSAAAAQPPRAASITLPYDRTCPVIYDNDYANDYVDWYLMAPPVSRISIGMAISTSRWPGRHRWDSPGCTGSNTKARTWTTHPLGTGIDFHSLAVADFDRLRARVVATPDRGIYVDVMLFGGSYECRDGWRGNPFNAQNNINGANGDPAGDGEGTESHILKTPAIIRLQEACLRARRQSRRRQERHDQRQVHYIHSVMASITLLSSNR